MARAADATEDRHVDVCIVCHLELEAAPLVARLRSRRRTRGHEFEIVQGSWSGRRAAVVRCPRTRAKLASAVEATLAVHQPRVVIAAGFATGLDAGFKKGEIVVASTCTNLEEQFTTDTLQRNAVSLPDGVHQGRIVSMPKLPRKAIAKRQLGEQAAAIAVDLQSFTIARICHEHEKSFSSIRVLSDDAAQDADPESLAVYHPSFSFRAGGLIGAWMQGVDRAGRVVTIRSSAKQWAEKLAQVLDVIVRRV